MRVLLTGGYGCIGAWIVRNLLERGDSTWIYDLKEDPRRLRLILTEDDLRQVGFVQGDVTDLSGLRSAIQKHGLTHLVHLAGLQVPTCRANPILGAHVNVVGTLTAFEAVRLSQGQVQRLVYASSAAVFGPSESYPRGPLDDDAPPRPSTHYGYFKVCNEGNARIYYQDHGLSSIGLRPWTVYGVGRDFGMTSEPTTAIKALALGRKHHITYGGWQDLQFVDDVAKIFVRCLEAPYQGAMSFNLRGHVVDLPAFHKALSVIEPAAQELITYGERQIPIAYNLADDALQRILGPVPNTPLEQGIRQTISLFKEIHAENRLDMSDLEP
jgi:nucleoside-diphosphate-sugar epimerase